MAERQILNLPKPHDKQQEALVDKRNRKVLNWGRRCFVAGTPVLTRDGYKPIETIKSGVVVASYNDVLDIVEYREVKVVHQFGVDVSPKAMVSFEVNGKRYESTYDHEYFVNGTWVRAIELAWGVLAPSEREKFKVLCEQYGEVIDYELEGWQNNFGFETSLRRFGVLQDGPRRENSEGTSSSSRDLAQEPVKQDSSEPYQQRQDRQSSPEPGVGDTGREHGSHDGSEPTDSQSWRELRDSYPEGFRRHSDTEIPAPTWKFDENGNVSQVSFQISPSKTGLYTGYIEGQELEIRQARVRASVPTYDLEVEVNHNYIVDGILAHNTGKSKLAGVKTSIEAIVNQGTYYILAPTIGNAKKIYWDEVLKQIWKDSPLVDKKFVKEVMKRKDWNEVGFNENELSVTIDYIENAEVTLPSGKTVIINHDKTKPRSKIVLYGVTEPDNILGIGLRGVVMDECAKMPNFWYVWRKVVRPMLGDYEGWAMFISTPLGIHNPWFEQVNIAKAKPEQYFFSHATAYDNPYFPDSEIEEARQDAIFENDVNTFEQEWLAEFVNPQGAIFPEFDLEVHTFDPKDLPKNGIYTLGVDFGFSPAPASILGVLIDEDNNWWIYDEDYGTDLDDDRVANIIKNKMMDTKFDAIIGDSQRKDTIAFMRRVHRIPIMPGPKGKGSLMHGINLIHKMLRLSKQGEPKLRIARNCTNTIREFQSYSRKRSAAGDFYDIPEDANNHSIDAIRYLLMRYLDDKDQQERITPSMQKTSTAKYSATTGRRIA